MAQYVKLYATVSHVLGAKKMLRCVIFCAKMSAVNSWRYHWQM
jgi:hypothetical protein